MRFRLVEEIARGGMGSIHRAVDDEIGREVAVKVMLEAVAGNAELARRFREEARISGRLQHPGIAPVYEMGELEDGRPYFTLKLVHGRTFAEILACRADPAEDRAEHLGVFEQVCQTLAYAHSRGVVHRDLKPSNIMVGAFGEVQVMDWGLAKTRPLGHDPEPPRPELLEAAADLLALLPKELIGEETEPGSVLGTPPYMSPEQARGEPIDARSDVFSLGSILCEILTGRPVYVGTSRREVLDKAILFVTADALARLDACGAPEELVTLARDCLELDPKDRPSDAGAVASALADHFEAQRERYRRSELARAEAQARVVEEKKRRRLAVALAVSVTALAMLGLGGWAWLDRLDRDRSSRASAAIAEAKDRLRVARSAPISDATPWVRALAAARSAETLLADGGKKSIRAEAEALRREVESLAFEADADRTILARIADVRSMREQHDEISNDIEEKGYSAAFLGRGLDLDSRPAAELAARIRSRPAEAAVEIAAALDAWAAIRRRREPSKNRWQNLIATAEIADPEPWRNRLRSILSKPIPPRDRLAELRALADATDPAAIPAASVVLLAKALEESGDLDRAIAVLKTARIGHPRDVWVHFELGGLYRECDPPRFVEAIRCYSAAQALRPETALALGVALDGNGELDEAIAVYRELIRIRPTNAVAHSNLGKVLRQKGRTDDSIRECKEAIRLRPDFSDGYLNLGVALLDKGEYDLAIQSEKLGLERASEKALPLYNIGVAYLRKKDPRAAIGPLREAAQLKPKLADAHSTLASALAAIGDQDGAIAEYRIGIGLKPNFAPAYVNLAAILADRNEFDAAIALLKDAIKIDPRIPESFTNLASNLLSKGDAIGSEKAAREAIRLRPSFATAHFRLGMALYRQHRAEEALAAYLDCQKYAEKGSSLEKNVVGSIQTARRWVKIVPRLPALLKGDEPPADAEEALELAHDCLTVSRRFAASARFYAFAFASKPEYAENLAAGFRYNAACASALAGSGGGEDAPGEEAERARLRSQSLRWLRADLESIDRTLTAKPTLRDGLVDLLRHWKIDPDLAGIRDDAAIGTLPEAERGDCRAFWSDYAKLLDRVEGR